MGGGDTAAAAGAMESAVVAARANRSLHRGSNFGGPALFAALLVALLAALLAGSPGLLASLTGGVAVPSQTADPLAAVLPGLFGELAETASTRRFQVYYCLFISITLCWNHLEGHAKYYSWFYSSGIAPAKKRGLGHHACRFYGVVPAPRLTPAQHNLAWAVTVLALVASCSPWAPRFCLLVAYVGWFLYYSQLFCATKASGHGANPIPGILLLLALSPASRPGSLPEGPEHYWALNFIKVQMAAMYCSSGLCKIMCSVRFRQCWADGITLQAYLFDGMWSRPGGELTWWLQAWACRCPRLLSMLSVVSLGVEAGFPLAVSSPRTGLCFALVGVGFHFGVYLLQGLDFVSQWCPWFLLFALQQPACGSWESVRASLWQGAEAFANASDAGLALAFLYTCASVLVSLAFVDLWYGEVLPWSCCPMFLLPRNIFRRDFPRWWTMTGVPEQRMAGYMEPLMNSPANAKCFMPEEDLRRFPHKVLQFGSMARVPKYLRKFVRGEVLGHPVDHVPIYANFSVSRDLEEALKATVRFTYACQEEDAWDDGKVNELIGLQRLCRHLFEQAPFEIKGQ